MTEKNEHDDRDDLMDIARKWYLRLEEEASNEAVQDDFDIWINEDPAHREAFDTVVDFWSAIDEMPEIQAIRETDPLLSTGLFSLDVTDDTDPQDIHKIGENIIPLPQKRTPPAQQKTTLSWRKWAVAAVVLLVTGFSLNFYASYLPPGTYQTTTGERQEIALGDGSILSLNTNSKASVEYTDTTRKIHLFKGEARFDVAKDAKRPFIVETSHGNIQAVGTSFNIYDTEDKVEVIVFEGTVAVDHRKYRKTEITRELSLPQPLSENAVFVQEGNRIAAFENGLSVVRHANELELSQKKAWQKGKLIFRGQKLSEVIREMSRYTNRKIVIGDDILGDMEMGGAFDTDDFEALLNAIEDAFPVRIIRFTPFVTVIVEA